MIIEEVVHVNGIPRKLIVFLHGYIDCAPSLDHKLETFYFRLHDVAVHLPQAPKICEVHQNKRQWYSMHRFDPDDERRTVPTLEECVKFYDRMTLGLREAYDNLMPYLEQTLQEYELDFKDLYLCGFSQGAMVALYTGLMSPEKFGGVVSFSGIMTASPYLHKHFRSTPDVLLIHGDDDKMVRFAAQKYTCRQLEGLGCKVDMSVISGGQHQVTPETLSVAADYINRKIAVPDL